MIKRAALARALISDPEILFLDEPTAGLDPQSARQFDALMIQLRTFLGLTLVMVTHDPESLAAMTTRVAFLHAKKVLVGDLNELKNNKNNDIQNYFRGVSHGPQAKE
jgi:phospholipid/cholesterol/gamma-HCH transport system ATP-binding protein